jgi:hypothetical protein
MSSLLGFEADLFEMQNQDKLKCYMTIMDSMTDAGNNVFNFFQSHTPEVINLRAKLL